MRSLRWRFAAGGALALGLLSLFFRGVEWAVLGSVFRSAHRGYLLGVVAATLLTYLVRAWRWGYLLAPLARVPFPRLFAVTVVGFMTSLVVPRAGEIVRPYLIGQRQGIPTSAAFASIILERLLDLITVLALFGLYLYVLPIPAAQTRGPLLGFLRWGGALAGVAALLVGVLLFSFHVHAERAVRMVERLLSWLPSGLALTLSRALRAFGEGLAVLRAPRRDLLMVAAQSVLVWLAIGLGFFWNNRAFGVDLPFHASFLIVVFLTVGVAIPTPGTVGGFHEFYLLALTQAYGVDKETAAAAGIASHALTNLPVLLLGLLFFGREGLTFGKVAEMTEKTPRNAPALSSPLSPEGRP